MRLAGLVPYFVDVDARTWAVDAAAAADLIARAPAEVGVHPSDGDTKHVLSLMCDDVAATAAELRAKGIEIRGDPEELSYGLVTTMVLPGGVEIDLYEPRHASPL